ncbi:peptide deformylase [Enterococcus sp. OL5]|uniref:peptide deformylase n=1 Tax=Enterococcus sp. OL5 TaxID=2590214 RepID=UPI00112D8339|nr:peptide deformylase [Enterococcus sp. OL5]TPR56463.1 peptide deformylase [Enterococcus sp. OL5]
MRYPIIITPDERLRRQAKPVKVITDELVQLLDDLYETMVAHDGIGIAAPQVGKNLQVAIVEVEEDDRFEMINPEIIASSGESLDVEGCLSIPHTFGTVKRADEITVRYFDREGEEMEVEAFGYLARAMQHEIDHLNGVLFVDKLVERISEEDLEKYMEEHEND